jgi:hypothetical protein
LGRKRTVPVDSTTLEGISSCCQRCKRGALPATAAKGHWNTF